MKKLTPKYVKILSGCHWWFPTERVAGENETLFEE